MKDSEYMSRVLAYNAGKLKNTKIQFTEFLMDGVNIAIPFTG